MTGSRSINELAIFSVGDFIFGVDTNQIQEIVTIKNPKLVTEVDAKCPFWVLQYNNKPLPVFNLRQYFCMHAPSSDTPPIPSIMTVVTFHRAKLTIACWVKTVENIISVSFRLLKPVPQIITKLAKKNCLWGFYEISGDLIPLIDLEHIVPDQVFNHYIKYLKCLKL